MGKLSEFGQILAERPDRRQLRNKAYPSFFSGVRELEMWRDLMRQQFPRFAADQSEAFLICIRDKAF